MMFSFECSCLCVRRKGKEKGNKVIRFEKEEHPREDKRGG